MSEILSDWHVFVHYHPSKKKCNWLDIIIRLSHCSLGNQEALGVLVNLEFPALTNSREINNAG